ncbi:MAG: alpha/beta fold hydrolase [Methyloceanibacter sp.]
MANQRWLVWGLLALAVAAALGLNTLAVDSRTRAADARYGGTVVATEVVPANVEVEGSGPSIVLIHGFGAAIDWWDEIAPALAADHRVIRVDLIGHGGTEAPRSGYAIERQASLVKAVLDQLGVGRVTVIGHSMGGEVATAFAEIEPHRVERMVLIDTPPQADTSFTLVTRLAFMPVVGELLSRFQTDKAVAKALRQGFAPGIPVPEKFVADFQQLTYTAFRSAHDGSTTYRKAKSIPDRLAALDPVPPLLVIFGAQDALISAASAKLFEAVPGARIEIIDGAGHSPMVEAPAKTLDLIDNFIKNAQNP